MLLVITNNLKNYIVTVYKRRKKTYYNILIFYNYK